MENRIPRLRHLSALLFVVFLASNACSPIFYSSIGQNVPMLESKGEVKLNVGYGSSAGNDFWSESTSGFAGQAAVAVGRSTSIIGSYYSLRLDDMDWTGRGTYYELGIGKFGEDQKRSLYGEIILGMGSGKIRNSNDLGEFANVNYIKPFLQPSGGYRGKNLECAFTPRLAVVSFNKSSSQLSDPIQSSQFYDFIQDKKTTFVFEPGVTVRAGVENLKFYFQYCYTTFTYSSEDFDPVLDSYVSIGLTLKIKGSTAAPQE